jgi:large subunit ribosomal protein L32
MVALTDCPRCGEKKQSHHVCPNCGTYNGIAVIEPRNAATA